MTKNNINYQLEMMFAEENLMLPEKFVFPNKLPCFDNDSSGEINTGLFYKETDCALRKFEDHEISLQLDKTSLQKLAQSTPKVIITFHIFIDGTLVTRNAVEPISMCPGIFNRSVHNLDIHWFIMGYIEPETNLFGDIDERSTRRGGKETQVIKLNDYHAIIRCILEEFISLQYEDFIIDVPVLTNE